MSVFSPLALTQALPFLPLAQGDIDYEVSRRGEPDLFANVLPEPATKVILVKDGKVAVPHGQGAIRRGTLRLGGSARLRTACQRP